MVKKNEEKDPNIRNTAYVYGLDTSNTASVYTYLQKAFGCTRKMYNVYVDRFYKQLEAANYENGNLPKITYDSPASIKLEYPYMKEIDSLSFCNVQINFKAAVKRYREDAYKEQYKKGALKKVKTIGKSLTFRDLKGLPSFHSKRDKQSFTTNNQPVEDNPKQKNDTIRLEGNLLYIPKLKEPIKLILHRPIQEGHKIKSVTFSYQAGKYSVSILTEYYKEIQPVTVEKHIGLDYSQAHFYVDNLGKTANYPKFYIHQMKRLAKLQKQLAKKEKGSSNWQKMVLRIAKLQHKVACQRKDFLHKLSTQLANEYDLISVEDINLRNMAGGLKLARNLHDNGFGMFRTFLVYKMAQRGKYFLKVDQYYPSSKICSKCGGYNGELTLKDRTYICANGCEPMDRDHNAAINIDTEGYRIYKETLATQVA